MLSSVNNNQPSFQGMYIIKGNAKNVEAAHRMIIDRCGGKFAELREATAKILGKPVQKSYSGFKDVETLNLVPIYSENQPHVHQLISTNEHVPNIENWNLTMNPPQRDPLDEMMKQVSVFQTPYGPRVEGNIRGIINGLQAKIKMIEEKMAPYKEAERTAQKGNMDKMSDFLIDCMQQIKQRLQEIRDLATVPYDEPKILNAKDVINAIKENRFNFITGEIK